MLSLLLPKKDRVISIIYGGGKRLNRQQKERGIVPMMPMIGDHDAENKIAITQRAITVEPRGHAKPQTP